MCAVYGFLNYGNKVSHRTLVKLIRDLSVAAECRGTDATGISYVCDGKMVTYKKAKRARKMHLHFPYGTKAVIGHNRFTTQGSEKQNFNNHPFFGSTSLHKFCLAHNGVLINDAEVKAQYKLPETNIETDTYAAVQLLETYETIDSSTLREVSEILTGSFVFTVLRDDNTLFLVRGNNPLTLYHFPELKLYIYSSTKEILQKAVLFSNLRGAADNITINEGDIVEISPDGKLSISQFSMNERDEWHSWWQMYCDGWGTETDLNNADILDICGYYGIEREKVELLLSYGYSLDELEELLMNSDFFEEALAEAQELNAEWMEY